jgi:hypothetical protein
VQRCRDLQEVCAAQQQFACGPVLTAVLGGTRASEVARAISEVQQAFAAQMARWVGGWRAAGRQAVQGHSWAWGVAVVAPWIDCCD